MVKTLVFVAVVGGFTGALCSNALLALAIGACVLLQTLLLLRPGRLPEAAGGERGATWDMVPLALGVAWGVLVSPDFAAGWNGGHTALLFCFLPLFARLAPLVPGRATLLLVVILLAAELGLSFWNWRGAGFPADHRFHGWRPFGTDAHLALLLLVVSFFSVLRRASFWAGFLGVVVAGLLIVLTQNRAEALAAVLVLPFAVDWRDPGQRRILAVVAALLLAFFLANPFNGGRGRVLGAWRSAVAEAAPDRSATSMGTRYELWKAALVACRETQGRGVGYGGFRPAIARFQAEGRVARDINTTLHAHSVWLHPLLCAGVPGLLGLLLTLGLLVRRLRRAAAAAPEANRLRTVLLAAFLLTGCIDAHLEDSARVFGLLVPWCLAGALFPPRGNPLGTGSGRETM